MYCFRDITTLTMTETACDLDKSFILDTTVKIIGHVRFPIRANVRYIR